MLKKRLSQKDILKNNILRNLYYVFTITIYFSLRALWVSTKNGLYDCCGNLIN